MSKYKAIIQELVGTAFNYPAGELQELMSKPEEDLNVTEVADKLKEHYRSTLESITKTHVLKADEKYKAGQRSKAQEFEKQLKEKFGVESDKQGDELIEEIIAASKAKSKNQKDYTDDDVKKHPEYVRMENDLKKKINETKAEADKSINEIKTQFSRKDVLRKAGDKALAIFEEMKPVLSTDPVKAAKQKQVLLDKLEDYEIEEVEGKYILSKDGKVAEDLYHNKLEFDAVVKNIASEYFDFQKAEERKSPNGDDPHRQQQQQQQQQSSYNGALPKSANDYEKMMNDNNLSIKDKMAINDHWEKVTADTAS